MVNIVVLMHAIEHRFHGSCCRAADMWTWDVVHAAAVSNASRLCVPVHPLNLFPMVQFGEGLLCDIKAVENALQLLDRS